MPTFLTIAAVNAALALASHPTAGRLPRPDEVERVTGSFAERGGAILGPDYARATQTAHRLGRQMAAFQVRYDVLLTPTLGMLPPRLGWIDMMLGDVDECGRRVFSVSPFTVWFNLTGQPAMVLPLGLTGNGFPVCVQAAARFGDEGMLFQLAGQLETARPWFARPPAGDSDEARRRRSPVAASGGDWFTASQLTNSVQSLGRGDWSG